MRFVARVLVTATLVTGALALAACSAQTTGDEPSVAAGSELNEQDFAAAEAKLSTLPYIPWGYTTDGCYARALYYSMTLAEAGIPTKHVYVYARPGTALYGIWGWHVAPVATKNGTDQLFVFDPALFPDRVVTVKDWVGVQGYTNPEATNYPDLYLSPGTSYLPVREQVLEDVVTPSAATYGEPTFAAMPKFTIGNVNLACDVMHRYLDREPNVPVTAKLEKHKGLSEATVRLVRSLTAKAKLTGTEAQLNTTCTTPAQTDTSTCAADSPTVKPTRPACCLTSATWCWSDTANAGRGDCVKEGTVEGSNVCNAHQWQPAAAAATTTN